MPMRYGIPDVSSSVRLPLDLHNDLLSMVKTRENPDGKYRYLSEALRETIRIGVILQKHEDSLKDPERAAELQAEMQKVVKNDDIFKWLETLSKSQRDAITMGVRMIEERGFEQEKLR